MEVLEGNKLIAEFMGVKFKMRFQAYHLDWNRLMPVVFKIRDIEIMAKKASSVHFAFTCDYKDMTINSIWLAVVQFIQWYNQNKK